MRKLASFSLLLLPLWMFAEVTGQTPPLANRAAVTNREKEDALLE